MRSIRLLLSFLLVSGALFAQPARKAPLVPCVIVAPALDEHNAVRMIAGPDGAQYPVFHPASNDDLTKAVQKELQRSFIQQALYLNELVRNYLRNTKPIAAAPPQEPMYLLLSNEDGGFARAGFWLEESAGGRQLMHTDYVDMVVDNKSLESGNFEEIFSHELAHQTLKTLIGPSNHGPSRKFHQSMSITDYPTALDEGFAEHFQTIFHNKTQNAATHRSDLGADADDLQLLWLSAADQHLRNEGVRRNLFIHPKPLPARIIESKPDLYALYTDAETSTAYDTTALLNGQQMLSSEGFVATLFYRLVNNEALGNTWEQASFYEPFLGHLSGSPSNELTPEENVYLKLFAAFRKSTSQSSRPVLIQMLDAYKQLFPKETGQINMIFLQTTWGATTSQTLANELEKAAHQGGTGDMQAFEGTHAFAEFQSVNKGLSANNLHFDSNLGPELWLVNKDFLIARAFWLKDRNLPLTINMNTANLWELMTIPGIDLVTAQTVLGARHQRGYFSSIADLQSLLPDPVFQKMKAMSEEMKTLPDFQRD